ILKKTHIGPADVGRRMTMNEFLEAEEAPGYCYELARGVLEVSEIPDEYPHGLIVSYLYRLVARYWDAHPDRIHRFGGTGEFRLWLPDLQSGRHPDVAVALKHTPRDLRGGRPPSFVIEVVSEGGEAHERDYVTKRQEYLAFGVLEYWIVDPWIRQI